MQYMENDYSEQERDAWQRGDYETAELLGALMDAEEMATEAENAAQADRDDQDKKIAELQEERDKLTDQLDRAYVLVEQAARVSDRNAILAVLIEGA